MSSATATSPIPPTPSLLATPLPLWPALLAVCVPTLLAFNEPPSATFFNQALSLLSWGVWCAVLAQRLPGPPAAGCASPGVWAMGAAVAVLVVCAVASAQWGAQPWDLALGAVGLLLAAALVFGMGLWVAGQDQATAVFKGFAVALVATALLGTLLGVVQVFAPSWPGKLGDGQLIAISSRTGCAVGNLRQPNHLNTLLMWGCVGAVWLAQAGHLRVRWAAALLLSFVFAMVLTASRTAYLGLGVMVLWGLVDRRLSGGLRRSLWALPLMYAACWAVMAVLAHVGAVSFGAEARLHDGSDISSSRFKIWADTLALIRMHPLTGVGFGDFNFAWSLTPFPNRPVAFFDHTHNLALQLAVELGLPLAALLLGLLGWGLWELVAHARGQRSHAALGPDAARATLVMVLLVGIHSQLEYPLWYAYFLLPTVFAWGLGLARAPRARSGTATSPLMSASARPSALRTGLQTASVLLAVGTLAAVADYLTVVSIFAPPKNAAPLEQRIARGQKSVLFGYQADYAAVTTADDPAQVMAAFRRPLHNLIDTRLMIAYANALNAHGEVDKARYVVARLREFRRFGNEPFLAVCNDTPPGEPLPYQCTPPSGAGLSWQGFLPRP